MPRPKSAFSRSTTTTSTASARDIGSRRKAPNSTQPVMLTWHLSDADLAGRAITDAIDRHSRRKRRLELPIGVKYDAAAKIVRVATSHF